MIEAQHVGRPLGHAVSRQSRPVSGSRLLTSPYLSAEEREILAEAMSPQQAVKAHTDLVGEGDRTDSLFIITTGWACRYETTREGARQLPALLVPGDVANLDSLMFERLDYGARTLTAVSLVTLLRSRAKALVARHPGIANAFTWLSMVENVVLSRWALSLGRRSARQPLAHLLCELSVRLGAESEGESSFAFPLTQDHLADALGLTAVHVNRTVRDLRREGLIRIEDRVMTLPNLTHLRYVAGFDPDYLHIDPQTNARLS